MYIRLQDFAIIAPGTTAASGLFLGPEVQDVYLERMRIALPGGSTGYSLHMYGGVHGSGMYSSFAHIDAPEFVGGAGVLVDGNASDTFWGQSKVIGGRIMASSKSVAGSYCVNQVAGELSMTDTDLENCDVGLHIMDSATVHPYVHPDGCCVNTGVQFDGSGAQNNDVVTSSGANSQINGARRNNIRVSGASEQVVYNDLGAGGTNVWNDAGVDAALSFVLASGKTAPQYVNLFFGDGSSGSLTNRNWQVAKNSANGFEIDDLAASTARLRFTPGANGNTDIAANGSGSIGFNWASGTGGVTFNNGAETTTASISSAGVGTFNGISDTGVTGTTQCAQFSSAGVLGGTGAPCPNADRQPQTLLRFAGHLSAYRLERPMAVLGEGIRQTSMSRSSPRSTHSTKRPPDAAPIPRCTLQTTELRSLAVSKDLTRLAAAIPVSC